MAHDREVYIGEVPLFRIVRWLVGSHWPMLDRRPDGVVTFYMWHRGLTVTLTPKGAGSPFTSVHVTGKLPWPTDAAMARDAESRLDVEVRCVPEQPIAPWRWLQIRYGEESLIEWDEPAVPCVGYRRPMELPLPFQTFLADAVPALAADPRIRALLLGGSAVTGGMDHWSDLDTIVVVADDAAESLCAEHPAVVARLGPLLTAFRGTHLGEPRLLLCLYDTPLLNVEVKFMAERELATLTTPATVYWSRGPAPTLPSPVAPKAFDVQWCADRVPLWPHYIGRRLGRGELFEVAASLDFLRTRVLAPLVALEAGTPPRGVRRIEETGSPRLAALARTLAPYEPAALGAAALAAFELAYSLLDGHPELVRHVAAEERAMGFLREVVERG
ncbi:MAG: hypothetical protein Q8P41_13950 [Pseudomonadota bacterium]|nr:hypothetical protein [Pseudomonadota bacterium]